MAGPIKKSLVDAKSRGFFSHLALPYWDYTINFHLGSIIFWPAARRFGSEMEFSSHISSILSRLP